MSPWKPFTSHHGRTIPYLRMVLLLNLGAFMFGMIRIFLLPSATIDYADIHFTRRIQEVHNMDTVTHPCPCTQITPSVKVKNESELKVPNIVHYIWYNTQTAPLQFHHMLSILSAHKILKPDVIYFHTDKEPNGPYWEQVKLLPNFRINYRHPPLTLFGEEVKKPMFYTSHSNVDRVKILMEYGGIYLDFDTFIIQPLDGLRKYECTIGLEQETKACGSIILCNKDSMFLRFWINSYLDDYRMDEWAYNTGQVPANLARRFPDLVHVEERRLNRPNFKELEYIWGPSKFNWQDNYAMHIWYRIWKDMSPYYQGIQPNPDTIKTMNNTFGEIARSIYYGSASIIPKDNFE